MGNKTAYQLQVSATEFLKKERARALLSSAWDVAFVFYNFLENFKLMLLIRPPRNKRCKFLCQRISKCFSCK